MGTATGADLSSLIRRFRTEAGLSQQMLADRARVSVQAVSALERGSRKVPYRYTLERIADALALTEEARIELELSAKRARGLRLEESAKTPPHNLPLQLTSFFGRDEVVKEIVDLFASTPLVSIVGTGGAGKTRVAVAVGTALLDSFADGVWFVDLSPISDPALVPQALAAALARARIAEPSALGNARRVPRAKTSLDRLRQLRTRYVRRADGRWIAPARVSQRRTARDQP